MDPTERSLQMRLASHKSWARTPDRSARTEAARTARQQRFIDQARELHPDGTDEQIAKAAESLRSAHYSELSLRSAQARRLKREAREAAERERIEDAITAEHAVAVGDDTAA